jgi:PleD family two-component response regulator
MRQHGFETPSVVISDSRDERIGARVIQAGALDYVTKGETTAEFLTQMIYRCFEKFRVRKELNQAQKRMTERTANPHGISG